MGEGTVRPNCPREEEIITKDDLSEPSDVEEEAAFKEILRFHKRQLPPGFYERTL